VDAAFARYQRERLAPTARVQRQARLWGDLWHSDGLLQKLRDVYLRDRDPGDQRFIAPLYGAAAGSPSPQVTAPVAI
jgi:salicylate hydroxylase